MVLIVELDGAEAVQVLSNLGSGKEAGMNTDKLFATLAVEQHLIKRRRQWLDERLIELYSGIWVPSRPDKGTMKLLKVVHYPETVYFPG